MTTTERITHRVYDRHYGAIYDRYYAPNLKITPAEVLELAQASDQITHYPHAHVLDEAPGIFRSWRDVARFCVRVTVLCLAAWGLVCLVCLL